ncbi:MAG: hypothetical protein WDW36_000464 [Sanguina aurantia]
MSQQDGGVPGVPPCNSAPPRFSKFLSLAGFDEGLNGRSPLSYPIVESFRLCIQAMLLPSFPFNILGSVLARNRTLMVRAVAADEKLVYRCAIEPRVRISRKGRTEVDLVSTASSSTDGKLVWRNTLTVVILSRGRAGTPAHTTPSEPTEPQGPKPEVDGTARPAGLSGSQPGKAGEAGKGSLDSEAGQHTLTPSSHSRWREAENALGSGVERLWRRRSFTMAGGRERLGERGGEAVEEEVIHRAATASRPLPQHLPGCSDPSWRADGQTVSSRKRHTVCVPDACERTAAVCQGGGDTQRERALGHMRVIDTWRLAGDVGRRYGALNGDWNPIHLHAAASRLFGFRRPIAHALMLVARCEASLRNQGVRPIYPAVLETEFKRPTLLPATLLCAWDSPADVGAAISGEGLRFAVLTEDSEKEVLVGRLLSRSE